VDVGVLPNYVKYCVPVCLASFEQLSVHHRFAHGGAGIPNNIYIYIYIEINLIDHPAIKWELQIIINDNNSLFDKIYM